MISSELRRQLVKMCRSKRTREVVFSEASPCEWQPRGVTDPKLGTAFTDDSAWEFAAELIETGHHVAIVELQKPAGKKAYVVVVDGATSGSQIYIKLQMMGDRVRGRSFHISTAGKRKIAASAVSASGEKDKNKGGKK